MALGESAWVGDGSPRPEAAHLPSIPHEDVKCQAEIGNASQAFLSRKLRAHGRCLKQQAKGKIPPEVDCRAHVPPRTGDAKTDKILTEAAEDLIARIGKRCGATDLAALGFPDGCTDAPPFTALELAGCLAATLDAQVDGLLVTLFPPPGPQ